MENKELFQNEAVLDGAAVAVAEEPPKKKKKGGKYGNPLGVKIFIICLLIVPLVTFAIFVVYGNLGGLVQAFFSVKVEDGISRTEFVGFQHFKDFFATINTKYMAYGNISVKEMIINSFAYLFLVMFV